MPGVKAWRRERSGESGERTQRSGVPDFVSRGKEGGQRKGNSHLLQAIATEGLTAAGGICCSCDRSSKSAQLGLSDI